MKLTLFRTPLDRLLNFMSSQVLGRRFRVFSVELILLFFAILVRVAEFMQRSGFLLHSFGTVN